MAELDEELLELRHQLGLSLGREQVLGMRWRLQIALGTAHHLAGMPETHPCRPCPDRGHMSQDVMCHLCRQQPGVLDSAAGAASGLLLQPAQVQHTALQPKHDIKASYERMPRRECLLLCSVEEAV